MEVSHQQGHVAASLWSTGRLDLMDQPHLAWHLSGGTTELLLVEPEGKNVKCTRIGGTTDISAGQLIDRTGVLLGLPFPAGKHMDALSKDAQGMELFRVKCPGLEFSLSGVQNKVQQFYEKQENSAETAAYALRCVAYAVKKATENALKEYGTVERIAGDTRYHTSVLVAQKFFAKPESMVLAYAKNFPDGLCGGPLACLMKVPLILVTTDESAAAANYAKSAGIQAGTVLGGEGLISDETLRKVLAMDENEQIIVK